MEKKGENQMDITIDVEDYKLNVRAAGVTMQGTFYDIVNNLSDQIAIQLEG